MEKIPLTALIESVTNELRTAERQAKAGGAEPIMQFEECEVEMAVEIEASAQGEVSIWVLKLGAGGKRTSANTIRVTFRRMDGGSVLAYVAEGLNQPGPKLGPPSR